MQEKSVILVATNGKPKTAHRLELEGVGSIHVVELRASEERPGSSGRRSARRGKAIGEWRVANAGGTTACPFSPIKIWKSGSGAWS